MKDSPTLISLSLYLHCTRREGEGGFGWTLPPQNPLLLPNPADFRVVQEVCGEERKVEGVVQGCARRTEGRRRELEVFLLS